MLTAAIFMLAWTQSVFLEPGHESGILNIDPPTPYIHYFGSNPPAGRVLVVHGLDTSNNTMRLISAALADAGFEVYAIDLPGHGNSSVKFQTDVAEQAIGNARQVLGERTIVLGHSLGAGLLLDLAETEQFSTMVLLAPPPISISQIHADRVLIATGELDIPRIRSFIPIATDIGGSQVESLVLPWGAHSSPILNPTYIERIVRWLRGDAVHVRTSARIVWIVVMFASAITFGVLFLPERRSEPLKISAFAILVQYLAGSGLALVILKVGNPVAWLRLFAADYLIGFLLIAGLCVSAAAVYTGAWAVRHKPYHFVTAVLAAAYVILVPGYLVCSRVLHMSLLDGRWWRFPFIALAALPLFICDEMVIRRIRPRWKSEIVALLTRALFLALISTGALTLNRTSGFLALIIPLIVVFWIGLWSAAGVVHRHTQSPLAAAVFAALVQGWAFAAWFVTI
jgi:pimeloyl-ACP methyl ester carboxylesterase